MNRIDVSKLPNDIIKEVIETFDPSVLSDRDTLNEIRFVNKAWSAFAATVLFKEFGDFHMGNYYEDMLFRVSTLSSSNLRGRIKTLTISKSVIVPRGSVVDTDSSEAFIGKAPREDVVQPRRQDDVFDNMMEGFQALGLEEASLAGRNSSVQGHSVVQAMELGSTRRDTFATVISGLEGRIRRVTEVLGSSFRFEGLTMVEPKHVTPGFGKDIPQFLSDRLTSTIAGALRSNDAFSELQRFSGDFSVKDLECLLPLIGVSEPGDPATSEPAAFLDTVRELDFNILTKGSVLNSTDALSRLVLACHRATSLSVRISGGGFHQMILGNPSNVGSPIQTPVSYPHIETLRLAGGIIGHAGQMLCVFDSFPNLKCLILDEIKFVGRDLLKWANLFDACSSGNHLGDMVSFRLERLTYWRPMVLLVDPLAEVPIYDDTCGRDYLRPLFTEYEDDIVALEDLINVVEKRRESKELDKDLWLSSFCRRKDILTTGSYYYTRNRGQRAAQ